MTGIARLNPFDGLFLRAEHLARMQDYTRELNRALGQAGGAGVVHGYRVSVPNTEQDAVLEVAPGLAIDPGGRPLLMTASHHRPLGDLAKASDGLWVIELVADDAPFGEEEVYGALCGDQCGTDSSPTCPYVGERVKVRLSPFGLAGIDGSTALDRRSRVASAWFERERREGAALLTTSDRDETDADFGAESWDKPTALVQGDAVAVGVLLRIADQWEVDAWIARRDRIDSPPQRGWQQRLGMRPVDVFVAQVLQFQVQLASRWPQASATFLSLANARHALPLLREAAAELRERHTKNPLEHVLSATALLEGALPRGATRHGLVASGIVELPPAGYLPLSGGEWRLEDEVHYMFGQQVELRFCACRPDYVAHAIEKAQHLDRVPLVAGEPKPQLDVLVPDGTWNPDGKLETGHNWVAFHRRRQRDCTARGWERIQVFRHDAWNEDDYGRLVDKVVRGEAAETENPATATFRADDPTVVTVEPSLDDWMDKAKQVTVVGLPDTEDSRPLVWVRAAALAATLGAADLLVAVRTGAVSQPATIHVVIDRPVIIG